MNVTTTTQSLQSLAREYEVIAHNLANANTVGFKRRLATMTAGAGTAEIVGGPKAIGDGAIDWTQGRLVQTGRSLDVALDGKGFLVVETPDGPLYTRHGVMRTSGDGMLVDAEGRPILGVSGPLVVPPNVGIDQISITPQGQIQAQGQPIGDLRIVEFEDPDGLMAAGLNAFRAPEKTEPTPAVKTTVHQGYQEASNVSPVTELVGLIRVTKFYEANARSMQASRDRGQSLMRVAMG